MSNLRYATILLVLFLIEFIVLAIEPHHRSDWLLENVLVVIFLALLALSYKKFPLSKVSYTLIFIFLCLHEIGSHYTYAEVPYDQFLLSHFGFSLNEYMGWERNHFDRLVHFSYGLLLAYPVREFYFRVAATKGFWGYFFPLDLVMATSMIYELIEWGAAEFFGGELGMAYLGTQGDVWDAHKDMLLATCGALIAMCITMLININIQKNFFGEWRESLRVKHKKPLGEEEIRRMLDK